MQTREARRVLRLRLLGLKGAGASRVLASRNVLIRRLATSLERQDYVSVRPLTSSALAFGERLPATEPTRVAYDVSCGEALRFGYGDFEHLQIEPARGGVALAWSTILPPDILLERLRPFIPGTGLGDLFVNADGSFHEFRLPSELALGTLLEAEPPQFWRLDLDERALTWQNDDQSGDGELRVGLMGYISDRYEPDYLAWLVTETATPRIGLSARALVADSQETIQLALASATQAESA